MRQNVLGLSWRAYADVPCCDAEREIYRHLCQYQRLSGCLSARHIVSIDIGPRRHHRGGGRA